MSTTTNLSDLVRAFAVQDWDTVDRIVAELDKAGWRSAFQVIGAAFAVAVHRRFGPGATRDEIAQFVADARSKYEGGDNLPALEMEGLIRAALGEHELVDNIDAEVALGVETFILGQLLQDNPLTEDQLVEFVSEVEEMAAEYMS